MKYTKANEKSWDFLSNSGYHWTVPISHEDYVKAVEGNLALYLTPTKSVPANWVPNLKGKKILGLAAGGGQQGPIFAAFGAEVTVFDLSEKQLEADRIVAARENYVIKTVKGDMTEKFPFMDESFDLIFHPVSNCYVENIQFVWDECYRVLKPGGILLSGFLTETGFIFGFDPSLKVINKMPYNPLKGLTTEEVDERIRYGRIHVQPYS